jgi:hypothetical protein
MKQYIRMNLFNLFLLFRYLFAFLEPGHEVHIVVTSAKDVKLTPVRDAFTHVFGRATTQGIVSFIDCFCYSLYSEFHRVYNQMLLLNQLVLKLVLKVYHFEKEFSDCKK